MTPGERPSGAPRVSVVIPTRDRAAYLEEAVASALEQTLRDLEVIVVDDGSEDRTGALLDALREEDPRLRVVRHPEPRGAQAARNAGAREARGPVVAFLDDDCVWAPTKLEKQLAAMGAERGVVYCRHAIHHQGRWIVEGEAGAARNATGALLRRNYIGTYAVVVRRDLLRAVGGFDESLPRLQDWDLLLRLARRTRFAFVPEILVRGRQLESGITMNREALPIAAARMVETHAPSLSRAELAALHYGLAKYLLVDGLTPTARRYFLRALRLDPRAPLHWAGVAASLLGPGPARWVRSWRRRRASAEAAERLP